MTKLINSQTSSEIANKRIDKIPLIEKLLILAMQRTGDDSLNLKETATDILNIFGGLSENNLISAIKNGAMGKYGIVRYKLTTQEIGRWIFLYKKENEI